MPDKSLMITIDGPAGGGKSTVARGVAAAIGFRYLDTGAVYRAATLACIRAGIDLTANRIDGDAVCQAISDCRLEFDWDPLDPQNLKVRLNGEDVTREIRTQAVTEKIRYVADLREARAIATAFQRKVAQGGRFVTEGRDQGTDVFPDAFLKVYLWATPEIRAKRRCEELIGVGESPDIAAVEKSIRLRDQLDMSREVGALRRAPDAVEVDTTNLSIDQAIAAVVSIAQGRMVQ